MRAVLACFVLVIAAPAWGDEGTADPDALLAEGSRLFTEEADYAGALAALEESHRIRPSWRALNGIALVHQQLGHLVVALDTYQQLLDQFSGELTEAQRATVQRRLDALLERIAIVTVEVPQEGVRVLLDGREVGRGAAELALRLEPGPHVVLVEGQDLQPETRDLDAFAGVRSRVRIELEPTEVRVVVREHGVRLERRFPRWVPWAIAGGAAVMGGLAGGLGLAASADAREFDRRVAEESGSPPVAVEGDEALRDRAERRGRLALELGIAAGAAGIGAIVAWALDRPHPVRETVEVAPAGAGVSVRIAF